MDLNNRMLVEKWISIRLVHGRFSYAVAIERSGLLTLCVYFFYSQLSCMCFAEKKYWARVFGMAKKKNMPQSQKAL